MSRRRLPSDLLLGLGAVLALLLTYAVPARWNRGPEGRWWEAVRRRSASLAGRVDSRAGPRPVSAYEFAGSLDRSLPATEAALWELGFVRNPVARLKTRDGQPEAGSWVYRETPLAPRQLHLMLFEADGQVDVYAHEELSNVHPLCGPAHFRGTGQSVGAGVRRVRDWLPLDTTDAPAEPPDGSWETMPDRVDQPGGESTT